MTEREIEPIDAAAAKMSVDDVFPILEAVGRVDQILDQARTTPSQSTTLLVVRDHLLDELSAFVDRRLIATEPALWAQLEPLARGAVEFWSGFLDLRYGAGGAVLGAPQKARLVCIVRAVSWTETRHGSNTANRGDLDPMQMAHPADAWWKSLTKQASAFERFVGGPNAKNYWSHELPLKAKSGIPTEADVSGIDKAKGHDDANFTPAMSFYFGVPYLLHRINGDPVYKCGELARDALFEGAVRYNGNPTVEPDYRKRLKENLDQTRCLP